VVAEGGDGIGEQSEGRTQRSELCNASLMSHKRVFQQAGGGSSSRVVDEVENYYKRPESVVEDVECFYDSQGRPIYSPEERRAQVGS